MEPSEVESIRWFCKICAPVPVTTYFYGLVCSHEYKKYFLTRNDDKYFVVY